MYWCSSSASARAEAWSWPNGFSTTTLAFPQAGSGEAADDCAEERRVGSRDRRPGMLGALDRCATTRRRSASSVKSPRQVRAAPRSARTPPRRAARPSRRSSHAHAAMSCSSVQSSTATPTIGQSRARAARAGTASGTSSPREIAGDPEDDEDIGVGVRVRRRSVACGACVVFRTSLCCRVRWRSPGGTYAGFVLGIKKARRLDSSRPSGTRAAALPSSSTHRRRR